MALPLLSSPAAIGGSPAVATHGILLGLLAAFGFALMALTVHDAAPLLGGSDLALWRGVVCVVVLLPLVARRLPLLVRPGAQWLWLRSLAGAGSVLCFFFTLQEASLSAARAMVDMAPVFVVLLAWLTREEKPTGIQVLVIAAMCGAAISLDLSSVAALSGRVLAIGLLGAFLASLAYFALRRAALRYSNPLVVFALGLGLVIAAPFASDTRLALPPAAAWPAILAVGLLGVAAQLVFTRVFLYLSAPLASALSTTALLFSVGLDVWLVGHRPVATEIVAYLVIMFGAASLHALERRRLAKDGNSR
jgi:drug/metabolite transporter (DMT)-like permease